MSDINSNDTTEIKVQVALRIRPFSAEELVNIPPRLQRSVISATPFTPNQVVVQCEKKQSFTFDHVFGPKSSQKEIYDKTVMNLVDQFLEGNNVTVIAFGHASSGKTHTIGTNNSSLTQESKGIISRSMTRLLSCINSAQYKTRKYSMKISFVEIYNDELIDLLCEGGNKKVNPVLAGLQEIRVNSAEEVMGLLSLGQLNRRANTQDPDKNNSNNNNSHLIVTVTLSQQKFIPVNGSSTNSSDTPPTTPNKFFSPKFGRDDLRLNKQFEGDWVTVTSKFHFIDLAGDEMEKGNFELEDKLKEHFSSTNETTTKIAIGNVICALGDPSQDETLLPYKNNKLTKILQNCLCNNSQALVIACISPTEYNVKETINTLKYAKYVRNMKHITSKTVYQEEEEGWNDLEHLQTLVLKLRSEVKALKNASAPDYDLDSGSTTSSSSSSVHNADISRQSSLSPPNSEKDINLLEDKFVILKSSFNDLSKEFANSKVLEENFEKLIIDHNRSYSEDSDTATLVQDDNSSSSSNDESRSNRNDKTFIQNVWPSFQKIVAPVFQEYEKSISSLENQLSLVRAALSHSESKMQIQERKLREVEGYDVQNKNTINDLKYKISKLGEREETTESYIKDLEAKLSSDTNERKKDQIIINNLKNRIEELTRNEKSDESAIRKLESRLEGNEISNSKMSKIDLQLEKDLRDKEDKYSILIERFDRQKNIDKEEKDWLLKEIKTRDGKILQLDKNVENLINEIEEMKRLKIEVTSRSRSNHSRSSSAASTVLNMDTHLITPRPSIKINEFSSVSSLLDDLQTTHEKTLAELTDIQKKYQASLAELKELRSHEQLENFAKINNSDSLSKQLETVHSDKDSSLETIKQEFENLQINYCETLKIVEELCGEIKKRDALAQLEVMPGKDSEYSYESYSDHQSELVQRLREEVKRNKDKQRKILEILAEKEKIPNIHLVTIIENNIAKLKTEMNRLSQEQVEMDNETIRDLQISLTTLEEQLVKAQEIQKNSQLNIESSNDNISQSKDLQNDMISELKNLADKIQKETVAKSQIIATLLYPSIKCQDSVQKLEDELEETKREFKRVIQAKNNNTVMSFQESSDISDNIGENVSDCLEQTSDEYLKELEDKVNDLQDQLTKTKVVQKDTIIQIPLDLSQKSVNEFQEKLDLLQKELVNKSETIEYLQVERDTVILLQEQFKNLKFDIRNKHELIESIKKDLANNAMLEEKLRQKEAQTLNLKINLLQVQKQEETLQKEITELRTCLETGDDADQVHQSELDRLRKELKNAHEREIVALERLQKLEARLGNDIEESQLQEQLDNLQNVEIIQKNKIIDLENRISEKGERVSEYLTQLRTDLSTAKESKISHIKTIEVLETKLKDVEYNSQLCILERQIQDLKLKESEQLQKMNSLEIKLNDQSASDFNQTKQFLEEVRMVLEREQKQEYEFTAITNSLEELKEDSRINSISNEIKELKCSKSDLCKKVQELQTKLTISEEQLLAFGRLQEEILYLKSFNGEQKITIQQSNLQLNQMRDSKESTVKELMTLKESFNLQKEMVKFLETEMKKLKEELTITQENHISLTQEFEKTSSLLETTQRQYANEKEQVKVLTIEVEAFKLAGGSGDKNVDSLREALTNTKLEMVTKDELLNELESEMIAIEKKRDHHINLSNKLTAALEENESKYKETVMELKSKMSVLEEELALAQESSKPNREIATSLKEKLFDVETRFENSKNSDKEQFKVIKEMETKLNEANDALTRKENKLMKQDSQINELEAVIQKSYLELQETKASEIEAEKRIKELESKIAETEIEVIKAVTEKQQKQIKESQITQDFKIKKAAINEFNYSNELLWESNDNLIAKIVELEARAKTLTNQNKNLQDKLTKYNSCDVDSLTEMKVKVKELQTVKDELENINEISFEKCSRLEEKVQSLMKQLWTLENDGNATTNQVAELNNQIINREKEIAVLKQKSGRKDLESEISRLSSENESLKVKIKGLSVQASKGINAALVRGLSEEFNYVSGSDKDKILIPKLLQHENTIAQQNTLIKNLQEHISELEQLLDEVCKDTSVGNNNNANSSLNTKKSLQQISNHAVQKTSENSLQIAELLEDVQKLNKKISKTENENIKSKQLAGKLKNTFNENEEELQKTKEELDLVLSQKQDLLKYVSELKSILDEARNEIEATKSAVETQKEQMEKTLDKERKAKEKSETARIALESKVERLMAKKSKFMCF